MKQWQRKKTFVGTAPKFISTTSSYKVWAAIIDRCENPNNNSYENYGGRGIKVCNRWINGEDGLTGYECFYLDLGQIPFDGATVERTNNNGDYCPENCSWATRKEQGRNKRNNVNYEYNGKTQCVSAWAEEYGMDYFTLRARLDRGWSIEDALNKPVRREYAYNGKSQTISEWAKEYKIDYEKLRRRIMNYGWSIENALKP